VCVCVYNIQKKNTNNTNISNLINSRRNCIRALDV
jgi:hypothetical protein